MSNCVCMIRTRIDKFIAVCSAMFARGSGGSVTFVQKQIEEVSHARR